MVNVKIYNLVFVVFPVVGLITVGLFNYIIDPYWVYQTPRVEGVNKVKPVFERHMRLARAHIVNKQRPAGLILGTSRAEFGIDPDHPGWSTSKVYNAAISGPTLYELMRYFEHALAVGSVKQVVLSLDFLIFNIDRPNGINLLEGRLNISRNGTNNFLSPVIDMPRTLFSMDAIEASIETLNSQHMDVMWRDNGQRDWYYNRKKISEKGGHRKAFQSVEDAYLNASWFPNPCKNFRFTDPISKSSTWSHYSRILQIAHENNIDLHIVLSPSHVRLWEALNAAGLWNYFEEWKTQLVELNEMAAARQQEMPFPLWDFAIYHELNAEEVPSINDEKVQMKWYWEASHYKTELGSIMLNRVFSYDNSFEYPDFGVKLDSGLLNAHLSNIRQQQFEYRKKNMRDFEEIEKRAKKAKRARSEMCNKSGIYREIRNN